MNIHEKLNYVELPSSNMEATKTFFSSVFNWEFTDYGNDYTAFSGQGLDGGFYPAQLKSTASSGSALLIFYSEDLQQTQKKILDNGGSIIQDIFSFPGGRRFHFCEPSGNEFAVWSDKE